MENIAAHPLRLSLGVLLSALGLTIAFHFFLAEHSHGFSFVLFVLLSVAAIHIVAWLGRGFHNRWAYVFLIPVVFNIVAEALYDNGVVHILPFLITFTSLAFFAYWLTSPPRSWREVNCLWTGRFIFQTVLPFLGLTRLFQGRSWGSRIGRIVLGLLIALPFLLIIGALFASADPLFSHALGQIFSSSFWARLAPRLLRDIIVGIWFLGFGWTIIIRILDKKVSTARGEGLRLKEQTALYAFLGILNLFFLLFIGFQLVYFFGGQNLIQSQNITYATYAREGFFQLLAVAGLVFALNVVLYWLTDFRDRVTRFLNTALIVETGVVIAAAIRRLSLYIDQYGLTVSRWWAMAAIFLIAAVLFAILISSLARFSYPAVSRILFIALLIVVSTLLLVNVESFVVRWNGDRFLAGKTNDLDTDYFTTLTSDAGPALVELVLQKWPTQNPKALLGDRERIWLINNERVNVSAQDRLRTYLQLWRPRVLSPDWRDRTWFEYRTRNALRRLP